MGTRGPSGSVWCRRRAASWRSPTPRWSRRCGGGRATAASNPATPARVRSAGAGPAPRHGGWVGWGGAARPHPTALAAERGGPAVLTPPSPGVASAFGMLVSDLRHDYRVSRIQLLAEADLDELQAVYERFEATGR